MPCAPRVPRVRTPPHASTPLALHLKLIVRRSAYYVCLRVPVPFLYGAVRASAPPPRASASAEPVSGTYYYPPHAFLCGAADNRRRRRVHEVVASISTSAVQYTLKQSLCPLACACLPGSTVRGVIHRSASVVRIEMVLSFISDRLQALRPPRPHARSATTPRSPLPNPKHQRLHRTRRRAGCSARYSTAVRGGRPRTESHAA